MVHRRDGEVGPAHAAARERAGRRTPAATSPRARGADRCRGGRVRPARRCTTCAVPELLRQGLRAALSRSSLVLGSCLTYETLISLGGQCSKLASSRHPGARSRGPACSTRSPRAGRCSLADLVSARPTCPGRPRTGSRSRLERHGVLARDDDGRFLLGGRLAAWGAVAGTRPRRRGPARARPARARRRARARSSTCARATTGSASRCTSGRAACATPCRSARCCRSTGVRAARCSSRGRRTRSTSTWRRESWPASGERGLGRERRRARGGRGERERAGVRRPRLRWSRRSA